MSVKFFVPQIIQPETSEFVEVATRAKVRIVSAIDNKFYEIAEDLNTSEQTVFQVSMQSIAFMAQNTSQLFSTMPVVVLNVPGCVYTREFMMHISAFPTEEWETFRRRMAKSGTMTTDPEEAESRVRPDGSKNTLTLSQARDEHRAKRASQPSMTQVKDEDPSSLPEPDEGFADDGMGE